MNRLGQMWGAAAALVWPTARFGHFAMLFRLHLLYLCRHGRPLSLARPRRFTELVQARKLRDRDQRLPQLIDKVAVKRFVADALGTEWVTPTLWSGDTLPTEPQWPRPFVVKSRHGCNQRRFVRRQRSPWAREAHDEWPAIRHAAAAWMRSRYGHWLDEWGYRGVSRGLLVEPFVGDGETLPIDYKLYVFHGRVAAIQVHLDREHDHRWMLFAPDWQRLSAPTADADPLPPETLGLMIHGAHVLARGFDFVRVDFYDVGPVPRFGEMTFYPGSGLDRFEPRTLDAMLGSIWMAGRTPD